jgi:beta-lactamase superfamily II metal-dependent hydrolase
VEIKGDWGCAVLPGDTENKLLEKYAEKGIAENAGILCLPHHGGASSGSEKFLFSASPEYVIISCGKGNSYGHPSESVLESVSEAGVAEKNIFRTDEGGAVRLKAVKYPFMTKEFVFVWQKKMKLSQAFRI